MDKFWMEAAKVVKPGGTVALWTLCRLLRLPIEEPLLITVQRLPSFVSVSVQGKLHYV